MIEVGLQSSDDGSPTSISAERTLHQTIKKVTEDIESFKFNTAISQMMIAATVFEKGTLSKKDFSLFLIILSSFAPHLTQDLWEELGNEGFIYNAPWPLANQNKCTVEQVSIAIQVNGKVRDEMLVNPDLTEEELITMALAREKVALWIQGQKPKKTFSVKGRLVSIVV